VDVARVTNHGDGVVDRRTGMGVLWRGAEQFLAVA
jgi:hypothetical protein